MALAEPAVFNFGDWDEFYESAMRYHEATRPQERLLNDRIETFRTYMSKNAVQYLGGFLRAHPRFDTTEGCDQWAMSVAEALSLRQISSEHKIKPVNAKNVSDVCVKYKKGKLSPSAFWRGLDELVGSNDLASKDQQDIFWITLKQEDQETLSRRCPVLDPSSEVWEKPDAETVKLAEQRICYVMELSFVDDKVAQTRSFLKFFPAITFLQFLTNALNCIAFEMNGMFGYPFFATLMVLQLFLCVFGTMKKRTALRKLECRQRDLIAPVV